ncbi:hypothetical protein TSOC_009026 [Tetrabaena socialis]|uniref:Uncharacterized protein n=1 Tax=Tetrabaena socialis TaxID=47790 RepID=A0A2J7ZX40_9CHLO|nr:hypothetical protein TSOC_009026 [Tetrabaena socialis]|eukprot:PNH04834.1 hypothetical protein TSOC_009026 [Tetrabaena socialis]
MVDVLRLTELLGQEEGGGGVDGQQVPYELAYSRWLSGWVLALCADAGREAGEELRITARGQHVERWKVPRASYPEGRVAYLQWREDLKKQHAATTTRLMAAAGYGTDSCKYGGRRAVGVVGCLMQGVQVFLERQFDEFLLKLGAGGDEAAAEAKMVDILQKSWRKMGELGRAAALRMPMGAREAALVGRALAPAAEPAAEQQQ